MSQAKSDLRKACEALYVDADGVPRCPLCQMPMNGEAESHLPACQLRALQESYANSLVAAAVEKAKGILNALQAAEEKSPQSRTSIFHLLEYIRAELSTVTPEAAAKELERIKAAAREPLNRTISEMVAYRFELRRVTETLLKYAEDVYPYPSRSGDDRASEESKRRTQIITDARGVLYETAIPSLEAAARKDGQ